eukprot:scaffold41690_cov167-Skeletonema_dohrnii-CCMP3373.AAC.1
MVTRILTLVRRVRTTPVATDGQPAAASSVEAKKEDESSALFTRENQLREAEATTVAVAVARPSKKAIARPSKSVDNDPQHAASQRKRQCSGSEGEDVVPKKIARKRPKKLCSADGCKNQEYVSGMVQIGNYAAAKGARVLLKAGKCASGMGQEGKFVVVMDVRINLKEEEVCERHGANVNAKRCSAEGCTSLARNGGVCIKLGAKIKRKLCNSDGCTKIAQKGGLCWRHGANTEGCKSHSRKGGKCHVHAKVRYENGFYIMDSNNCLNHVLFLLVAGRNEG